MAGYKPSPVEIARARYDEAKAILDAWDHRLATAQANHYTATKQAGDTLSTKRALNAVEAQHDDAAAQARIAQQTWINATNKDLWPARRNAA